MGEWSKRIGEEGEGIVESFLKVIGWEEPQRNFDIKCFSPSKHAIKSERKTHGVDRYFAYRNPLVNRGLVHAIVSSKCTTAPYPVKPLTPFTGYFTDLATAIECFQRSEVRNRSSRSFQGVDSAENVGVLFWISLAPTADWGGSLLPKLSTFKPKDSVRFGKIFVVDNECASFIFDTYTSLKLLGGGVAPQYFYPNTGSNYDQAGKISSGQILPVEYLTSGVLLLTLNPKDADKSFVVSSRDNFSADRLRRLIGLAHEITQDLPSRTMILFPDYTRLDHEQAVREVKQGFTDRTFVTSVSIGTYRGDFRNIVDA